MKQITQGKTLICNFSTSHGTFSTKTRANRVAKCRGASILRVAHEVNTRGGIKYVQKTYFQMLIHDLTSSEIAMVEVDYTFILLAIIIGREDKSE